MLLLWALPAWALDIPEFDADRRFYLSPPGFEFPHDQVEVALAEARHPTYVVVFEAVKDGNLPPGNVSETEEAIEAVWDRWRLEGMEPRESTLAVLAMDEREVRLLAGIRWDYDFGFHGERLERIIDWSFMRPARDGDLDKALAELVRAYDHDLEEVLEKQGKKAEWKQASEEESRLERARREEAWALQKQKEEESAAHRAAMEAEEQAQRRASLERVARQVVPVAVGSVACGAPPLMAGVVLLLRRRRAKVAEEKFLAALEWWKGRLSLAEEGFADLHINVETRGPVLALKTRGPRTAETLGQAAALVDRIQVGLAALRAHVDGCVPGRRVGWFATAPWEAATTRLSSPVSWEARGIEGRVFEGTSEVDGVDPEALVEEILDSLDDAGAAWQRLLDAAEAEGRDARLDLPLDGLTESRTALAEVGLPAGWTAAHPLAQDPEATWERLEALRHSDPVAYLEQLEAAKEEAGKAEDRVDVVVMAASAARSAMAQAADPDASGLDTVMDLPERDPEVPRREAEEAYGRLEAALQAAQDEEAVAGDAAIVVEAAAEWKERKRTLIETVLTVANRVQEAVAAMASLHVEVEAARARAAELARHHAESTMAKVWTELAEAGVDQGEGQAALAKAWELLAQKHHVHAEKRALEALREQQEGAKNHREMVAVMEQLEAAHGEASAVFARLEAERARREQGLNETGREAGEFLAAGDDKLHQLRASWAEGAADWGDRLRAVKEVLASWDRGVSAARSVVYVTRSRDSGTRDSWSRRTRTSSSRSSSYGSSGGFSSGGGGASRASSRSGSHRSGGRRF